MLTIPQDLKDYIIKLEKFTNDRKKQKFNIDGASNEYVEKAFPMIKKFIEFAVDVNESGKEDEDFIKTNNLLNQGLSTNSQNTCFFEIYLNLLKETHQDQKVYDFCHYMIQRLADPHFESGRKAIAMVQLREPFVARLVSALPKVVDKQFKEMVDEIRLSRLADLGNQKRWKDVISFYEEFPDIIEDENYKGDVCLHLATAYSSILNFSHSLKFYSNLLRDFLGINLAKDGSFYNHVYESPELIDKIMDARESLPGDHEKFDQFLMDYVADDEISLASDKPKKLEMELRSFEINLNQLIFYVENGTAFCVSPSPKEYLLAILNLLKFSKMGKLGYRNLSNGSFIASIYAEKNRDLIENTITRINKIPDTSSLKMMTSQSNVFAQELVLKVLTLEDKCKDLEKENQSLKRKLEETTHQSNFFQSEAKKPKHTVIVDQQAYAVTNINQST